MTKEQIARALAALDDVSIRQLEVAGERLTKRKDALHAFGQVFLDVANERQGGFGQAKWHLGKQSRRPMIESQRSSRTGRRCSGDTRARRWKSATLEELKILGEIQLAVNAGTVLATFPIEAVARRRLPGR